MLACPFDCGQLFELSSPRFDHEPRWWRYFPNNFQGLPEEPNPELSPNSPDLIQSNPATTCDQPTNVVPLARYQTRSLCIVVVPNVAIERVVVCLD